MDIRQQLIKQGYFEENFHSIKYVKHLNTLWKGIVDYGYIYKEIPIKNPQNVGRKPTEEYTVFKVLRDQKENIEQAMLDMNIALAKEEITGNDGKKSEFYTFKSINLPELKQLVRGICKIKEANVKQMQDTSFHSR